MGHSMLVKLRTYMRMYRHILYNILKMLSLRILKWLYFPMKLATLSSQMMPGLLCHGDRLQASMGVASQDSGDIASANRQTPLMHERPDLYILIS